jgi:hypothetical protein
LRLDRYVAATPLDDLFADGQSDAGTGELFPFVKSLEHAEYLVEILRGDSQSGTPTPLSSSFRTKLERGSTIPDTAPKAQRGQPVVPRFF